MLRMCNYCCPFDLRELRSEKYIGKEEYYLTVYSSAMELIENLSWKELTGISEKEFTD